MAASVAQRPMLLGEQHHGRRGKHRASAAASAESVTEATVGQLQALPEHGSLLFCQTRTQTEPQPLAGPARSESDHDNDTQALLGIECVDSHEEEHDGTKPQHTRAAPLPWLPLLLVGLLFILYAALLQEAATRFELWFYEHGTLTGPEDWRLVARAGRESRLQALRTAVQRGDTTSHRGCFLGANPSSAPHTAVVPMDADNWRECVRERFPELHPQALLGSYTLDGKELLADLPLDQLRDRTVRLRQYPLLGGMPSPDFASMRKATLMEEAKRLGVPTRREVTALGERKHRTWRPVNEVASECAAKWEERHGTAPETVVPTSEASSSSHATASGTTHSSEPSPSTGRTSILMTQMPLSLDLTKEALRQKCAQRGIAMRKVVRQQDGTAGLKRLTKEELLEVAKTQEKMR